MTKLLHIGRRVTRVLYNTLQSAHLPAPHFHCHAGKDKTHFMKCFIEIYKHINRK